MDTDATQRHFDLIARISEQRDKKAFEELFAYFAPRIKALMLKQNSSSELAEDLMQETMMTVWLKAGQFSSWRGSPGAWIFTIARNKRIDRFRKQGSRHYVDVDELEFADEAPDGEESMLADERDRLVSLAAEKLPEDLKQIVHMAFVDELSQTEIAGQLGIPLGTVKSRTRRAYRLIKEELEDVL